MVKRKNNYSEKSFEELVCLVKTFDKKAVNELIFRAKKGDSNSMDKVLSLYEGLVHKHASRFFINGQTIEDLEQIARCVVIESIYKFDGELGSDFIFFVSTNVKNKLGSMLKKKENHTDFTSLDTPSGDGITLCDNLKDEYSIEDSYTEKEQIRALLKGLGNLSKSDREFIIYVHAERGNFQKYCDEHKKEISYGQARWRKERIIKKLREEMKDFE